MNMSHLKTTCPILIKFSMYYVNMKRQKRDIISDLHDLELLLGWFCWKSKIYPTLDVLSAGYVHPFVLEGCLVLSVVSATEQPRRLNICMFGSVCCISHRAAPST